jgi:hypothetical protein
MDFIKNKFQIVVARYNEDISWLLPYKDITIIYNKGDYHPLLSKFETIQLNNVGRESHTYLYHIINNYENLKDTTIFFQGNISDHSEKILDIEDYFQNNDFIGKLDNYEINKLKNEIIHFGKYKTDLKQGNLKKCDLTPYDWITKIIGIKINNDNFTKVVWNANFSIKKHLILNKPLSFYKNILRFINNHYNPEEGHFLERTWYLIFNKDFEPKKLIKYIILKNIDHLKIINNYLNKNIFKEDIHVWLPIQANIELNSDIKINLLKSIFKYTKIYPIINNNEFYIKIKSKNDISLLIEFDSLNNNDNFKIEILIGAWNNSRTIIRDYNNNKIISSYEKETLNENEFIHFLFNFNKKILISKNNDIIFNLDNFFEITKIKNIYIKNNLKNNIYIDYNTDNKYIKDNIKINLFNNLYEDIEEFYKKNYLENYIEEINIINFL